MSEAWPYSPVLWGISRRGGVIAAGCMVAVACMTVTATRGVAADRTSASTSAPGDRISFEIPAQPLASALQAYGVRTGLQIMYESRSATGLQSRAVTGEFSREAALELLLSGTGLRVRYATPTAITLARGTGLDLPPPDPLLEANLSIGELRIRASKETDPAALQHYAESVQIDIQAALRKDPRTGSGNYTARLELWIDAAHTIRKARFVRSTGDEARDAAVTAVLLGLRTTSRFAPANIPMPIRIGIVVKSQ